MKILIREDIDICGTSVEAIAVLPQDKDSIYKALLNQYYTKEQADKISNGELWYSHDNCTILFYEEIEDWR